MDVHEDSVRIQDHDSKDADKNDSSSLSPRSPAAFVLLFEREILKIFRRSKNGKEMHKRGGGKGNVTRVKLFAHQEDDRDNDHLPGFLVAHCNGICILNASINSINAIRHKDDKSVVILNLRDHSVHDIDGMRRIFFIYFMDEYDADDFESIWNISSDFIADHGHDDDENDNNALIVLGKLDCPDVVGGTGTTSDLVSEKETFSDAEDIFAADDMFDASTQQWPSEPWMP